MPHTHLSHTKSRRDLAGSLRGSRPRKHARLRHRRLQAERLEDRRLLAGDFELSSLLPANGGDGSSGFVVNGITNEGLLGSPPYEVAAAGRRQSAIASMTSTWRPQGTEEPTPISPKRTSSLAERSEGGFPN